MTTDEGSARGLRENREIAAELHEVADLLEQQGASPFRVRAYRRGAETLSSLREPVAQLLERGGRAALVELPGIGEGIAALVEERVRRGRLELLDRLRGAVDPEALFRTVPGIGAELAGRVHETLHLESLEALEAAAHDGRLDSVPGFGPRRVRGVRSCLADRLGTRRRAPRSAPRPPVELLLDVDRRYREAAGKGRLPRIAPRRFNPSGRAWLPIGHFEEGGWHFTALFSNTARAHRLGKTHDWVVIFFYDGDHREGQHTVVTEWQGPLGGLRVVRGREAKCRNYYERALERSQMATAPEGTRGPREARP